MPYVSRYKLQLQGIPLTLVTVANIAKFISERLFELHYNFWKWMMQMLRKETQDLRPEGTLGLGTLFADDEDEAVCIFTYSFFPNRFLLQISTISNLIFNQF